MVSVLESEAEQDDASDHEWRGDEGRSEADLRLEMAVVFADVVAGEKVVDPVAAELAEESSDYGRKIEIAKMTRSLLVGLKSGI